MMETVAAAIAGGLCLIPFYVFGPNIFRASKFLCLSGFHPQQR